MTPAAALDHLQEHGCNVYHPEGSCAWQQRCDEPGCVKQAVMGTPRIHGQPLGYRSTCRDHRPHGWPEG